MSNDAAHDLLGYLEGQSLEQAAKKFEASGSDLIKELKDISEYFPVITAVFKPFTLFYSYEITRRENHKKIEAVKATMLEFMKVLLELRHIPHTDEKGRDGVTTSMRLQKMLVPVGKDIKECGSACDVYVKRNVLSRTIRSKNFEEHLMHYIKLFEVHRQRLLSALSLHTAIGMDTANKKLDDQNQRLESIDVKLEALFRKLDTPRELAIMSFIKENGGPTQCIKDPDTLQQLIVRSGDTSIAKFNENMSGRHSGETLSVIRNTLMKELTEDVEKIFSRNVAAFSERLELQSEQLTTAIAVESEHIIQSFNSGAHDRIKDPDLKIIWKEMGWKASVKARHFVMGLHDYYSDIYSRIRDASDPMTADMSSPLLSPPKQTSFTSSPDKQLVPAVAINMKDKWALAYINATYVQPILEAVDDDGTGMISIKEVNVFTTSRPAEWSLPHWLAYWAVGWHASITQYKNKIYRLVRAMFETVGHVLPANRGYVDAYLGHETFYRIELVLRSTRSMQTNIFYDSALTQTTESYTAEEEERIAGLLKKIKYELDSPTTVSLLTGGGRIERYIFPLIYLLLRHHLSVIKIACKYVLDPRETRSLTKSFVSLLQTMSYRIQNLEAVFKQTNLDIHSRLNNFAFGMFQLSYGNVKRSPKFNSFSQWTSQDEEGENSQALISIPTDSKSLSVFLDKSLKYGPQDGFQSIDYYEFEPSRFETRHPMQGTWTGFISRMDIDSGKHITHMLRLSFRVFANRIKFTGKGETYLEAYEFEGYVRRHQSNYTLEFEVDNEDELKQKASGLLDVANDTITISWSDALKDEDPDDPYYQPVTLRRIAPTLVRYRYTPSEFKEDPVGARWRFAYKAAFHLAREKLWSIHFYRARTGERKRFVELCTRSLIAGMDLSPREPLTKIESLEMEQLLYELSPSEARYYQALSFFEMSKYPWHPYACDACQLGIIKTRIMCLQCMTDDYADNIELCSSCLHKSPSTRGFIHDITHPILKVHEILHDYHLSGVVQRAWRSINRYKEEIRPDAGQLYRHEDIRVCVCCTQPLTTSHWACISCQKDDVYICMDCESAEQLPAFSDSAHILKHHLVFLCNIPAVSTQGNVEERLTVLQERFTHLEQKMSSGMAAIHYQIEDKMSDLERRMSSLEQRLMAYELNAEHRYNTMEALMRLVVAQTATLSSSYSHPNLLSMVDDRSPGILSRAVSPQGPTKVYFNRSNTPEVSSSTSSSLSVNPSPNYIPVITDAPKSKRPLPNAPLPNRPLRGNTLS